ncbi:hypothetical protein J3Q64DRAFT_1822905 [Phycomyces blakesleeanus]|uniref:Uncharacterized protein n=1 Tax=Phycomyces blakesleeanus TaxID=4837 RepID=A0ABR3AUL6_PHYBL
MTTSKQYNMKALCMLISVTSYYFYYYITSVYGICFVKDLPDVVVLTKQHLDLTEYGLQRKCGYKSKLVDRFWYVFVAVSHRNGQCVAKFGFRDINQCLSTKVRLVCCSEFSTFARGSLKIPFNKTREEELVY